MLTAKKKISKKQMKEDKLVTTYYNFNNFFTENQAKILIGAGIVALLVVALFLYNNKKKSDNLTAANLLAKVIPLYENGSYKEAIEGKPSENIVGLKKIVDDYGSTDQGNLAKIYLANSYFVTGNLDAAFETYNDYSGSNPLFEATAFAGKAGILESKKELEKAASLFKDAAHLSKENPSNAEYLLKAGIILKKLGNQKEAELIFKNIKKDYKNNPVSLEVDRYLTQISN